MWTAFETQTRTFAFDGLNNHAEQIACESQERQCRHADVEKRLNLGGLF